MQNRLVVSALLVVAVLTTGGFASNGAHASPRQWAIVNFSDPVALHGRVLMGRYLVVHDDERMAKGEPCTAVYRFDPERGPQGVEVEFMCKPDQRAVCEKTTFSVRRDPDLGINLITDYQFAGDSEAHGVPTR